MFDKRLCLIVATFLSFLSLPHLTKAQTWTQLNPTNNTLSPRDIHTAVYDTANNRMIIFGGAAAPGAFLNSVWVLSNANGLDNTTSTWTQLFPIDNTPTRRFGHTAVYDPTSNRMTIFGGYDGGDKNDVWVLSNANGLDTVTSTWTQLFPTGSIPTTRVGHTAVYDITYNRMIIFGGDNDTSDLNDVWVLSNANGLDSTTSSWTQLFPMGSMPEPHDGHTAVYDAVSNRMTIFGGWDGRELNDVWVLSNANGLDTVTSTWTQLFPTGSTPTSRDGHTAVYDPISNRMTIFGGENGVIGISFNDVWVLSNANGVGESPAWSQLFPMGSIPTARVGHTAVYDSNNNRMTIYGGSPDFGDSSLGDVWVLDGANGLPVPTFPSIPSLKLFTGQSITHAFNLEDYNNGGIADSYSIVSNFLDLSSLSGSSVNQTDYSTATVGSNTYQGANTLGSSTASNLVKYSTYKINKLPHVGLTVGSSWDVNVGNYTYNSNGLAIPLSFGNPDALIVSDTTSISATWVGNTIIHITSLQPFSGTMNIDVIASPNATSPFGIDIDKERIQVYTNLLANSTFSTAQDTTSYGVQGLGDPFYVLPTMSWLSSYTDSAGIQANGVWAFNFSNPTTYTFVKVTPFSFNYQNVTTGQWYIARMHISSDTPNNNLIADFYAYTQQLASGLVGDIAANNNYGISSTWTWIETPILSHTIGKSGFFQFFLIGQPTTNANVYIDELQWIQATPVLVQARSNTQTHYLYGQFTAGSDTTGWGQQLLIYDYPGQTYPPGSISVSNGLVLNFAGASEDSVEGIKWTANNGVQGSGHAYTYPVTPGRDIGVRATATLESGDFNDLWIMLIAAIGVQTSGQQNISPPCNIVASAQVGALTGGEYRAVGTAVDPYYQFQFAVRSNQEGVLVLNDIDFDTDNDDPNFGDPNLFP